ncbi:MAG: hypothetical protein IIX72_01220 [Oscillospiraceae bacterium]|nr:hypothetical protein [Oscillospiraceae bacterium]
MAERYNKLYSLPGNLYAAGSPVIICAGALLKDNQSGSVLAQLKFRNICDVGISAVKVQVRGFDVSGEEICKVEHQYLDLNVKRNGLFGAKEAIALPERSVRAYDVQVLAVFFTDGSRYFAEEQLWESIPEQPQLRSKLFDRELIRQYKLESSEKSEYVPMEYKDLWLCACGEVNTEEEENCYSCGENLQQLKDNLNVDFLLEAKNLRLMEEAKVAAARESSREHSAKIIKRVLMVVLPLIIIAAAVMFFMSRSEQKEADYEMAGVLYAAEKYAEAAEAYDALGEYKDSVTMADKARAILSERNSYDKAKKFLENGRWDDAYNAFSAMGDYEEAPQLATEAIYCKAVELAEKGEHAKAAEIFLSIADYKDSAEMAKSFVKLLSGCEQSYNAECEGPLSVSYTYDEAGLIKTKTEHFSAYKGMSDRVLEYKWNGDGSYSVTEGETVRDYDTWGVLLRENGVDTYTFDYGYYDDGSIYYIGSYDAEGNFVSELVYDEQGNLIRRTNADGSVINIQNEYDAEGRLVKTENFDADNSFIDRTSYEYDAEGLLKRSTFMDLENNTVVTSYSYSVFYTPDKAE